MHHIKELIQLSQQQQNSALQQSANSTSADPLLFRLMDGIYRSTYADEADAARDLFPGTPAGHPVFLNLKAALGEYLKDSILHFNLRLEQETDSTAVYAECYKQWLNVRYLSGPNAAAFALSLATQLLRIAEKFDFTLLAMDIALYLRIQHCLREQDGGQCADADRQYQYWRAVYDAEYQAEKCYSALMARSLASGPGAAAVVGAAVEHTAVLEPLMQQYPGAKLHLYGRLIAVMKEMASGDFSGALRQCEEATGFFKNKPYVAATSLQVFYYYRLICSIHLRQLETGSDSAERCLQFCGSDSYNWFKIKELNLILLLHARQYDAAAALFQAVTAEANFGGLPDHVKACWQVFALYLRLLPREGGPDAPAVPGNGPDWPGQPLEAVGEGDARLTAALLAAEFVSLLQQGQFEVLHGKAARIGQFCQAHLDACSSRRSYLFLKLLALIPEQSFQRGAILTAAAPALVRLKTIPMSLSNQTAELEIVPYEDLWALALNSIEKQ